LKEERTEPQGEVLVEVGFELSLLVLHRVNVWKLGVGLGVKRLLVGLRGVADWLEPRLEREVVLEERPCHPEPWCPASLCLFRRNPWAGTWLFLYQSGTLSRCNDLCTLS